MRLTGSGLGCSDWPRCNGTSFTPELSTFTLIELGNRMMTSAVAIPCLLAVAPFRRDLLLIACVALLWRATYEPGDRPPARDKLTTGVCGCCPCWASHR